MRLNFSNQRVLAVVAHPDDADYLCAGTLARAQADGATIGICVLCQGDRGQPNEPLEDLVEVRRREMQAAAELLGASVMFGQISDGHLQDVPEQRKILVEFYRHFRPSLVLAHAANDYHSDHRAASALAEAASWYSTSAGHESQSAVLPSQPTLWWMDTINMMDFEPGFFIDVSDYLALKREMLRCHESQQLRGSEGDFSPLEAQMVRQSETRGAQAGVRAAEAFRLHLAWKRAAAW